MKQHVTRAGVIALLFLVVASSAVAWSVTETKTKTLPIAGDVLITTAFMATSGETITVTMWPADNSVTIDHIDLAKVSPKPRTGCNGCSIQVSGTGDHDADVTLTNTRAAKSTFHLRVYVSTGEHIGVNVKFGR